jgi:hypothetical protein
LADLRQVKQVGIERRLSVPRIRIEVENARLVVRRVDSVVVDAVGDCAQQRRIAVVIEGNWQACAEA